MVLVSKGDLVNEDERRRAVDVISRLSPGSRVIPISQGQVDPGIVLGAAINGISLPNDDQTAFQFATTTISPAGPWDPHELAGLLDTTDHQLLRGKGWFSDHDDNLYELQIVGRRWAIDNWVGDAPNAIVLIAVNSNDLATTKTMFHERLFFSFALFRKGSLIMPVNRVSKSHTTLHKIQMSKSITTHEMRDLNQDKMITMTV